MTPMQLVEFLISQGWAEDKAIRYTRRLMEFPWGKYLKVNGKWLPPEEWLEDC